MLSTASPSSLTGPSVVVPPSPGFSQLAMTVSCARINSGGLIKPNPYVEVIVDGKPPKKTEVSRATCQPKWGPDTGAMTLMVTPYSKLLFRLFDKSAFKKDSLLGEHTMELYGVLKKNEGKLEELTMSVDLYHATPNKAVNGNGEQQGTMSVKIGELVIQLDGMTVDMNATPSASPPIHTAGAASTSPTNSSSSSVRPKPPRPNPPRPSRAAPRLPQTDQAPKPEVNGHETGAASSSSILPPLNASRASASSTTSNAGGLNTSGGKLWP